MTAFTRAAAAALTVAALATPAHAAAPIPPAPTDTTVATVATVKPAKQAARRQWRAMTRADRRYHCRNYLAHPRLYGRGYRYGARLGGATPRRARALWLGWRWLLHRKCPGVLS